MAKQNITKDQIVSYIMATVVQGATKKDAYVQHVNSNIKQVYDGIARLEQTPEFLDLYVAITSDDNLRVNALVSNAKLDYAMMVRKNMQIMGEVYKKVEGDEGSLKDKAAAVRLGNETIQSMAVIGAMNAGGQNNPEAGKLNKSAAVLGSGS